MDNRNCKDETRTTRRYFLRQTTLAGLGAATTAAAPAFAAEPRPRRKPNIIYLMIDDAGYGDFSAFGSKHIQTPSMERFCAEGLKFTQHYSGSAVCAPTRCVLMTGLSTGHCRRRDNTAKAGLEDFKGARPLVFLEPEDVTVAEALKKEGYATGGIGKWGLGNPGSTGEPSKQGFDHWYGYLDQVHAHDHFTEELWRDDKMEEIPGNTGKKKGVYAHDLFEEETFKFIRRYKDRPFFLYLAYTLPHGAFVIPHEDPAYAPYKDKPWSQTVKNYAAMITRADRTAGKVLELLEELGLDEKTVIFYTSDNGPNKPFLAPLDSAAGMRGTKSMLYEGGLRAAMAVRWPGHAPAGAVSKFVWDMRDFFPTACDLAGVAPPEGLDGISVKPTLLGKKQAEREHLYWEIHSPFQQATRMGKWKAIRFGTKEPVELYDLDADVGETTDVANKNPKVVAKITKILDTSRSESRYFPAKETRANKKKK